MAQVSAAESAFADADLCRRLLVDVRCCNSRCNDAIQRATRNAATLRRCNRRAVQHATAAALRLRCTVACTAVRFRRNLSKFRRAAAIARYDPLLSTASACCCLPQVNALLLDTTSIPIDLKARLKPPVPVRPPMSTPAPRRPSPSARPRSAEPAKPVAAFPHRRRRRALFMGTPVP